MDGALAFTHVCVDSSRTVLEHHRPFHSMQLLELTSISYDYLHRVIKWG